jgi:hypothetical protein
MLRVARMERVCSGKKFCSPYIGGMGDWILVWREAADGEGVRAGFGRILCEKEVKS